MKKNDQITKNKNNLDYNKNHNIYNNNDYMKVVNIVLQ